MTEASRYQGLRTVLPAIDELPTTLQIKIQILETIRAIKDADGTGPTTLAETATKLLSSCKSAGLEDIETYASTVASQLSAHAAVEAHQTAMDHSGKDAPAYPTNPPETQRPRSPSRPTAQHPIHLPEPANESLMMLSNIMQLLDPPVLIQLERGKLEGLSRAETFLLKQRIGMC